MKYNFNHAIERKGSGCLKWDFCKELTGEENLLPMWVADMDFESPPAVKEAVRRRAEHGVFGYSLRSESYYQAIINWMKRRFDWEIKKDWMVFTPGVVPALHMAVQAFSDPGDKVILQTPVYYPFMDAVKRNRRTLICNPLKIQEGRYSMDLEGFERAADEGARLLILCSPHNPVGRVWGQEELRRLAEICLYHNLILVSDEAHGDLIMPGYRHRPTATISEKIAEMTVTFTAPNKTFNIAGLQIANAVISNPALRHRFAKTAEAAGIGMANLFGLAAAEAGYKQGEEWLDQLNSYLHENYLFLRDFIHSKIPQLKVFPLEGTYLAWIDFRALSKSDQEIKNLLYKKARLWLSEGVIFGEGGSGFQRMNIACPRNRLEESLQRLAEALN